MSDELESLQTPALLVDLDRVEHNLDRTLEILGGDASRWRPHVKTSKIPEVFDMVLGAGVRHFKCATTKEARCLLSRASEPIDLLVAMAHRGANLRAVVALAQEFSRHVLSVLCEDAAHAVEVCTTGLGIFVDLDPGYHRTGIPMSDRARISATVEAAGKALRGLHFYDGHLHGTSPDERRAMCADLYGGFVELAAELGRPDCELITSGTPSFPMAVSYEGFAPFEHRVSPGTVVYWDTTSEDLRIGGYEFAVHVLARVISRPNHERVTCDAGSKAIDAAAGDPCCRVEGWPGLRALKPSEEHLPLRIETGEAPAVGSLVRLVPRHVCPTVNLADQAVLLRSGKISDIVPVAARGHDTSRC